MAKYFYKGSPILAPLSITSNQPIFASDTVSLKQIRVAQNSQRWEVSFNVVTNDNAVELLLSSVENQANPETMIMPQLKEVCDIGYGNVYDDFIASTVATSAGSFTINMTKSTGNGILPKGSFVKFSNHNKIYLLKTTIDFSTFTSGDIEIYPSLRVPLSTGVQMLTFDEVTLSYFNSMDDIKGITYSDGVLASPGTITVIEAL